MPASLLLTLSLTAATTLYAHENTRVNRGTVNIALANPNGIVLLADSMQTVQGPTGLQFKQPVQKLFRLDDKTVCSIAGFASESGWRTPQLDTDVTGIIADFRDQLSKKPVSELDAKLKAIAFIVGFYIDLVANRHEVLAGPGTPSNQYEFEIIVAGYDSDGKPKLKKLKLTPVVTQAADGHHYWSHTVSAEAADLGPGLAYLLGGIQDVSREVLDRPEDFGDVPAIREYALAKKRDGGRTLTLTQMTLLATDMAAQTARRTPSVGGPDQIAILGQGEILAFKEPSFPDPPRPLKFLVVVGIRLEGAINLMAAPGAHVLWIRSEFVGIRNPTLQLDGQFFYGCEILDSIVEYGGGLTDFGPTNTVVNNMILPGYPVASTTEMLRIMNAFKWSHEPPSGPSLPPTMSPR